MSALEVDLDPSPDETTILLHRAVEEWGGAWTEEGDEIVLPTRAGIREGITRVRPNLEPLAAGTRLSLRIVGEALRVNASAAMVLLLGALGGIVVVAWPLHAALRSLAPMGALLALVAWLLVASRFRSSGPHEFLAFVREIAEPEVEDSDSA